MERIFNYAILTAIPDARRGERVNIGMIIFLPERLDVRFSDLAKLRALTGHDWTAYAGEATERLSSMFDPKLDPSEFNQRIAALEQIIQPTDTGWFGLDKIEDYEERITEILRALVKRPQAEIEKHASRINTEIAKEFRRTGVLAKRTESIEDHKVVRDYLVSTEEDLRADFILKNGTYHVTATLDLRRDSVHIKEATWKAVVLDRAKVVLKPGARRLGVYAAAPKADQFHSHISVLGDYSDDIFNWLDRKDRERYAQAIYGAISITGGFFSSK